MQYIPKQKQEKNKRKCFKSHTFPNFRIQEQMVKSCRKLHTAAFVLCKIEVALKRGALQLKHTMPWNQKQPFNIVTNFKVNILTVSESIAKALASTVLTEPIYKMYTTLMFRKKMQNLSWGHGCHLGLPDCPPWQEICHPWALDSGCHSEEQKRKEISVMQHCHIIPSCDLEVRSWFCARPVFHNVCFPNAPECYQWRAGSPNTTEFLNRTMYICSTGMFTVQF